LELEAAVRKFADEKFSVFVRESLLLDDPLALPRPYADYAIMWIWDTKRASVTVGERLAHISLSA